MNRMYVVALATALFAAPAAHAHEGGADVKGVVKEIAGETLTVRSGDGDRVFALTPETRFVVGGRQGSREDVRAGDRVAVHGKNVAGRLQAVQVRTAAKPPDAGK